MTENLIGVYDETDEIVYALKFAELPDWGNVGALSSRQIDAIRFQYDFETIELNQEISLNYDVLSFSRNSYPELQDISELNTIFNIKLVSEHSITSRDYHSYIEENKIEFIVYDKNQLDTKLVNSKLLQLIYSNDRYVIFKIQNGP